MNNNIAMPAHLDYHLMCVHCEGRVFAGGKWAERKDLAEADITVTFDCRCGSFPREYAGVGKFGTEIIFVREFEDPVV